jgi:two-component system OmpR family sensor kinase
VFRSLYSKLAAVLTGLFFLVGLAFIAVILFSSDMYQQEVIQRLNIKLAEHIVSERLLIRENRVDREALKDIFHMLMVINPSIEVYLLAPDGKILAFSAPKGKVRREAVDVRPVERLLEGGEKIPLLGDDPRDPGGKKVFTAARIPEKGRLEGYLYVILGGQAYDSVVDKLQGSYILRLSAWMMGASLFFALAAGLILFALLTGRLRRLARAVAAYKGGDALKLSSLAVKDGLNEGDEIDRLATTFQNMAERIQEQVERLRRSEALRSELIANVSHDLRTPLSTLQGYIETLLLKEGSLGREERKKYLETAVRHCERLTKLVSELLELAKLESDEIGLHPEPFNLSELVQDVIQKFHLRARDRGIQLVPPENRDLPLVRGDIGLIERVLENLIENAIHYTPKGGMVGLELARERDDISVRVRDTGSGIPEKELPHIFNRFYKLDKSRKQEAGHSGLGLAIARKILELHERTIEVNSVLRAGTTFTFHLPVHQPA